MRLEIAPEDEYEDEQDGSDDELPDDRAPLAAVTLALWRFARSFRLLLAVGLGMLVAVTFLCTVPLYSSLVSTVQLQQQLRAEAPANLNLEVDTTLQPASTSTVGEVLAQAASVSHHFLEDLAPTSTWYLRVETDFPPTAIDGLSVPNLEHPINQKAVLRPYVFPFSAALPHMHLLAGRLPQTTGPGQLPEILVTKELGLKPGDTISIGYSHLTFKVVGVWTPKNPSDPYWNGAGDVFAPIFTRCLGPSCGADVYPVLFAQSTFFALFGVTPATSAANSLPLTLHYIAFTRPRRITVASIPGLLGTISTYRASLNGTLYTTTGVTGLGVSTQLDSVLKAQQNQFGLLTQPLYIIIVQMVGVILVFVLAIASLLVESQASETATLTSRGASRWQLIINYGLQGLGMSLLAALLGPFLAAGVSLVIVSVFVPDASSILQQEQLARPEAVAQIVSPQLVFQPALAGALLGLLAVLIAAWAAGRRDIVTLRREAGRQGRPAFWQRFYLDLGLAALAVAGYLELGEFGGLNIRQQLGGSVGSKADPLQLAAPALLLLAGAFIAVRLFPLATRSGAWIARKLRGATAMLAFAQLERNGGQFACLALLMALAVGLGVFALTFQASLATNTLADSRFLVGCDQRVVLQGPAAGTPPTAPFEAQLAALPGVEAITPVYRTLGTNSSDDTNVDLLGIDPATFAGVAYWQSDFASQPLANLLQDLAAHAQGAEAGDQSHPIWALIDPQFAATYHLAPGLVFTMMPQDSGDSLFFRVEAIVAHFPTLGETGVSGKLVFNLADYANAIEGPQGAGGYINYIGPNEYWLRTSSNAAAAKQRAEALENPNLWVHTVINRSTVEQQAMNDPLSAGMTGLLLIGAAITVVLAVLGSVIQASVAAGQRRTQFAILRTLGGGRAQLIGILLAQQAVVYGFGLVAGSALGVVLVTATLPFLQFTTATVNTTEQLLPPFLLAFNPATLAGFYVALLLAFAAALSSGVLVALRGGLGQAIRLGED